MVIVISLEFLIPIDGAADSQRFESDVDWDTFCYKIAGEMGVKKDLLCLAYRFSTSPAKEMPKLLTKPIHLSNLWNDARKELEIMASKKSKSKEMKVHLQDRSPKATDKHDKKAVGFYGFSISKFVCAHLF